MLNTDWTPLNSEHIQQIGLSCN